jgi:hypothetical protein
MHHVLVDFKGNSNKSLCLLGSNYVLIPNGKWDACDFGIALVSYLITISPVDNVRNHIFITIWIDNNCKCVSDIKRHL